MLRPHRAPTHDRRAALPAQGDSPGDFLRFWESLQVREGRQRRGRKKLTAERAAYFRLMQKGVSNTEACRIVGIDGRTEKRRR